jgi:hypothetical protein
MELRPKFNGEIQPAEAGDFSYGTFQPFAKNANGDRSAKEYLNGHAFFVPNVIDFEYILIDVNETDEEELLKLILN